MKYLPSSWDPLSFAVPANSQLRARRRCAERYDSELSSSIFRTGRVSAAAVRILVGERCQLCKKDEQWLKICRDTHTAPTNVGVSHRVYMLKQ